MHVYACVCGGVAISVGGTGHQSCAPLEVPVMCTWACLDLCISWSMLIMAGSIFQDLLPFSGPVAREAHEWSWQSGLTGCWAGLV